MSDSEDSEYGPVDATWGSQAPSTPTTTNDNDDQPKGWDSLIDHSVKLKGDLGHGQLHRRGTNFKPITEDLILAQRLNKPVGKKKMQEAIRETESKLGLPISKEKNKPRKKKVVTTVDSTRKSRSSTSMSTNRLQSQRHVEVPSTTRIPTASNCGDGSSWLQSALVETPFWEQKKDDIPTRAPHHLPPTSPSSSSTSFNTNNRPPANNSSMANGIAAIKPKVESNAWSNGKVKDDWNSVQAQDLEPFINIAWGKPATVNPSTAGWGGESVKPMAASGWGEAAAPTPAKEEPKANKTRNGWGAKEETKANGNTGGWEQAANPRWGSEPAAKVGSGTTDIGSGSNTGGWGSTAATTTSTTNNNINQPNAIPSSRPSWLSAIPSRDNNSNSYQQSTSPPSQSNGGSRFSNPTKQRYSENIPFKVPKPVNYRSDQTTPIPIATAPPPPPENSILITINVELSEAVKVSVDIRELDEPYELAKEFGQKNHIQGEKIIMALTKLFTTQKDLALRKKQQKLQRRVFSNPSPSNSQYSQQQQRPKYNNVYTNSSYSQQQQQQAAPLSPPTPFTRKAYY